MQNPPPNHFDLLRLALSALVLYSHSFQMAGYEATEPLKAATAGQHTLGMLAVDAFFAVSGFLVTRSWVRTPGVSFIRNRLLRIYPAFWVATAVSVAAATTSTDDPVGYLSRLTNNADGVFRHLLLDRIEGIDDSQVYARTRAPGIVNGSLWSLHPEVVCYALVAALGAVGGLGRRATLIAFVGCWAGYVYLAWNAVPPADGPLFRLAGFFAAGAALHFWPGVLARRWVLATATALGIGAAFLPPPWFTCVLPICLPIIAVGIGNTPRLSGPTVLSRIDLSYGVYLYAWPVQQMLVHYGLVTTPLTLFAVATPISLVLAAGSWVLIERPCLRFKSHGRAVNGTPPRG